MNPKVDTILEKEIRWRDEFLELRRIALNSGLDEDIKWGCACYTLNGANVFLIHGFKEYCALLFFKGALIEDPAGVLIQQTKNVQSARQMRFTNVPEILDQESVINSIIRKSIEVEQSGLKVSFKKTEDFEVPLEFQSRLEANEALRLAFEKLTPGRQRAYLSHFSQPKQSTTRESRIDKAMPHIMAGRGLND